MTSLFAVTISIYSLNEESGCLGKFNDIVKVLYLLNSQAMIRMLFSLRLKLLSQLSQVNQKRKLYILLNTYNSIFFRYKLIFPFLSLSLPSIHKT